MIWYPYQQMKKMDPPYKIVDAQGVYLHTEDQTLIDSVSSWWCMIHGYKHPELPAAIQAQAGKFCHVMLGGLTHQPVEDLSNKLAEFLRGDLDYCFFSDSGSVGVEVALKLAVQYYVNLGTPRPMVLALEHAYHGDTFRAMEVGDDEDYHLAFPNKRDVVHIPTEISALEEAFAQYHDQLTCVLVEPLLQGAGGMRMYDISFLKRARELCDQYGVLLIFDEVATGFGRTGNRFVADLVLPDILVLGKALTGGYIGHAATVANHKVYDAFYSDDPNHALMHGPTFMGNALACAVACASLDILAEGRWQEQVAMLETALTAGLAPCRELPQVEDVRVLGSIGVVETTRPVNMAAMQDFFVRRGVWIRPFNRLVYVMPPYVSPREDVERLCAAMHDVLSLPGMLA